MEASALRAPALARGPLGAPLLRLRSDEQLLALFRAGSEEAFGAIHDRYRQRLFAYVRQMLSRRSRQDAEDVLQDVFVRAYGALRADEREVNLRAWLYRVAHNRCIDHLRRPTPARRRDLRDVAQAAARPDRGGPAARGPAPARRGRRPPARAAALRAADARDRRHVLRRPRRGAGRHRPRGEVAARPRARRPRRGRRGARRRLLRDPRRPDGLLRPRREGLRAGAQAHALVRRLPRVPHGACAACGAPSPRSRRSRRPVRSLAAKRSGSAAAAPPRAARPRAAAVPPRPRRAATLATATACKVAAVVCTAALDRRRRGRGPASSATTPRPRPPRPTRPPAARARGAAEPVRGRRPARRCTGR